MIRALANSIASVSFHKILEKHTNYPESKKHLQKEVENYSIDAFEKSKKHTWREEEIEIVKQKAIRMTKNDLKKYPDVIIPDSTIKESVADTMQEMLLIN